ncbi:hypothetical protein [Flavobacterium aestuarii]|uniref:hypothetical protein n=1 Tax=Flavobacterium aestuarii TaxID=3149227 RepID=UPI0032B424B6
MSSVITKNLKTYLQQIEDQSQNVIMDGYFHVNHVIDAFNKGEEIGNKKAFEEIKDKLMRSSTQMFLYGLDVMKGLENAGFKTSQFFVNPFAFKFMLTTPLENTYNEEFIDKFFQLSNEIQNKFKQEFGIVMQLYFIQDSDINENELKTDGFLKVENV